MIVVWMWLSAALAAPLSADQAVSVALAQSVQVAQARAAVDAARGEVAATAWLRHEPFVQGRASVLGEVYGVSLTQQVSLSGEGLADHRRARATWEQAAALRTRTELEVAAAVRVAWMHAVEATQAVHLTAEGLDRAVGLREAAEARLAAGEGSLLEARLARLQETEARTQWVTAVVVEGERLGALASFTGMMPDAVELPTDPLEGMDEVAPVAGDRSDLVAAQEALAAAQARLARERSGTLPPVQLGAFYEMEEGDHRAGLSLGLTVPVWRRNADGRAAAVAGVAVAEASVAAQAREAGAEQAATGRVLRVLAAEVAEGDPREEARLALEGVVQGYQRGEFDLLTASLMRQQILEGQRAWLAQRRWIGEARVAAALALDAVGLLGGE